MVTWKLCAVWLSGQTLMLRLRQNVNFSLEPLSRESALLKRTSQGPQPAASWRA